jgi:hypothetical protein
MKKPVSRVALAQRLEETTRRAMAIVDVETVARDAKTAKLREARLIKEAADLANHSPRPKRKPPTG